MQHKLACIITIIFIIIVITIFIYGKMSTMLQVNMAHVSFAILETR